MIQASFGLDCTTTKILTNPQTVEAVTRRQIKPIHLQINPTNQCPLDCKFCSCRRRDKQLVMPRDCWQDLLQRFQPLGAKAVTLTGGGEPLMHPQINELIRDSRAQGMVVGLVTNGLCWEHLDPEAAKELVWCRVSLHADSTLTSAQLQALVNRAPEIDWAINYVLTDDFDPEHLVQFVRLAAAYSFTHIRVSDDLFAKKSQIARARQALANSNLTWAPVVFTVREIGEGMAPCLLSLLKPNIGPDGKIYACCGAQYAEATPSFDLPAGWCLGGVDDIDRIWEEQAWFDGSVCKLCHYGRINRALYQLWNAREIRNPEFP